MSANNSKPKSIRQKRILSIAAKNPNASIEEIAENVSTASPDVVESVLSEYGDPAVSETEQQDSTLATSDGGTPNVDLESPKTSAHGPSPETSSSDISLETTASESSEETAQSEPAKSNPLDSELTDARRETLEAIRANPEATQRELAEQLGVSAPTINNRVNAMTGFEWENRHAFVEAVFGSGSLDETEVADNGASSASNADVTEADLSNDHSVEEMSHGQFEKLLERIDAIARLLEGDDEPRGTFEGDDEPLGTFEDAELAHKVILASIESEDISKDEEIEIIRRIT